MKSRFLTRLEMDIGNASDLQEVGCLLAQKAAYFARLGDYVQAKSIVDELRAPSSENISGDAVCWINYAEGIMMHYAGDYVGARLKWERSRAVARSIGSRKILALCSSWLAFSYYLSERLDFLTKNSIDAIGVTDRNNYSARSRIALTVALCYHFCGRHASARDWYIQSRLAAVEEGDETMLAALIHDMAWMSVTSKRNELLSGQDPPDETSLFALNAESAKSYEGLIRSSSLPAMTPLLAAQSDILNEHWERAIQSITANFASSREQGFGRLQAGLLADRAFCFASMGRLGEAESDASNASELISSELHIDDRAVVHSRLACTFAMLNREALQLHHQAEAADAWNELFAFKKQMLEAVAAIESIAVSSNFL